MTLFLAGKKLNIIHQQYIHGGNILFEGINLIVLNGLYNLVDKL